MTLPEAKAQIPPPSSELIQQQPSTLLNTFQQLVQDTLREERGATSEHLRQREVRQNQHLDQLAIFLAAHIQTSFVEFLNQLRNPLTSSQPPP